jgi:uncharacterized membrane protein YoaK (UPF0700 family)
VAKETDHRAAVVLAAIAGFVDAAGFLALFGLFTAHVTGNLAVVGAALAREHTERAAVRLAVIPVFMVGVAATTLVVRRLRAQGSPPLARLLVLEVTALGGGTWAWPSAPGGRQLRETGRRLTD